MLADVLVDASGGDDLDDRHRARAAVDPVGTAESGIAVTGFHAYSLTCIIPYLRAARLPDT
jgi:hypothetical protein